MAKIGNVEFNLISEGRNHNNEVTQHPVEKGSDIVDHVKNQLLTYSIEGIVGDNENPATKHQELVRIWSSRQVVSYRGRSTLSQCVITSLTTTVDSSSRKGFRFSMEIMEVRIAKPSTVGLLPVTLRADMAEVGNAGRVQAR